MTKLRTVEEILAEQRAKLPKTKMMEELVKLDTVKHLKYKEVQDLQDKLNAAKRAQESAEADVHYMLQIIRMAGWKFGEDGDKKDNRWKWTAHAEQGPSVYSKSKWKQVWELQAVKYNFFVSISERTDLKRDKYEVKVHGKRMEPSGSSVYTNHQYVAETYEDKRETDMKFKALEDAQAFAEGWMAILLVDHRAELDYEQEIAAQCTPEDIEYAKNRRHV